MTTNSQNILPRSYRTGHSKLSAFKTLAAFIINKVRNHWLNPDNWLRMPLSKPPKTI